MELFCLGLFLTVFGIGSLIELFLIRKRERKIK